MPETCWADYKCNKAFNNIQLVFFSTLIQLSLPHNTFYLRLQRPGIPMGKHFVKPLLLMSRRIWNIKVKPTALEERRWIEMAQKRRGFGIQVLFLGNTLGTRGRTARIRQPRLLVAESRHCLKQSTVTSFGHVTTESVFRVTLKHF